MNFYVLFKMAWRNIFLHRIKTTVIGSIIVFGTFLALIGNSVVDAIAEGMKRSVTESVTGDIQIYSKKSKDKLSVYGNNDGAMPELEPIQSFSKIREEIQKLSEVREIVPMGINFAMMNPGNLLDRKLEDLRSAYLKRDRTSTLIKKREHVRQIVRDIQSKLEVQASGIIDMNAETWIGSKKALEQVSLDSFWRNFDSHFEERIEYLANKIAPLIFDDNMYYLMYLGTIPSVFQKSFPLFEIVKGEQIPDGKRGFLFHDYVYETVIKNRVARRLDQINREKKEHHGLISQNKSMQEKIKANLDQASEIYSELSSEDLELLKKELQEFLHLKEGDIQKLIMNFLDMNDNNFKDRYEFYYSHIAPHIALYRVKIGDTIPINAFTKNGTSATSNVKVYGTYRFRNFENSPLSGNFNLLDIVSFRELYGFQTESQKKETAELLKEMGTQDVDRENIEELFAEETERKASVEMHHKNLPSKNRKKEKRENLDLSVLHKKRESQKKDYTRDEAEDGLFMNAAIFIKDPKKVDFVVQKINSLSEERGLDVQALSWQESAGIVGQLILVVRIVLFVIIAILFTVAALMIMNSLLMATMDRAREIGTIRAIGASRKVIYRVFLLETVLLSITFVVLGALLALAVIFYVERVGIPAEGDVAAFFFSGPRLYLHASAYHFVSVLFGMVIVSVLAVQYPAWLAVRISPLKAMQKAN